MPWRASRRASGRVCSYFSTESVFHICDGRLFSTNRNTNHIKAIRLTSHTKPRYPHRSRVEDSSLLGFWDALDRKPKIEPASGFHLHERHQRRSPDDQIDLAPPDAEVVVDEGPPTADEPPGGDPFSEETEGDGRGSSHAPKVDRRARAPSPRRGVCKRNSAARDVRRDAPASPRSDRGRPRTAPRERPGGHTVSVVR